MPLSSLDASLCSFPEEVWTTAFHELKQRIRHCFTRQESCYRALAYVQGLMSPVERKNGWQLAEVMGEVTPYAMQHLLDRAKWNCQHTDKPFALHSQLLKAAQSCRAVRRLQSLKPLA